MKNTIDRYVESYDDLTEVELLQTYDAIRVLAKESPEEFDRYLTDLSVEDDIHWELIYHAIADKPQAWDDWILKEFRRCFFEAKKSPSKEVRKKILQPLSCLSFVDKMSSDFYEQIAVFLAEEIDSPDRIIQYYAMTYLLDLMAMGELTPSVKTLAQMQQFLYDDDWKMRYHAYTNLRVINGIPDDFQLKWKDNIRFNLFDTEII